MKKFFFNQQHSRWILALLLVLMLLLTACGGGGSAPAETGEAEAPPAQTAESETSQEPETDPETPVSSGETMSESQIAALFSGGREMSEVSYEMNITGPTMDTMKTRIWLKGERMRSESEAMGINFIMIYDTEAVYTLDPQEKTAMKMPVDMGMDGTMEPITAEDLTEDIDTETMEYLGTEMVNGIQCHVVQTVDSESGVQMKMWLHTDYGFPMKMEGQGNNPEDQFLMEVTNFQTGGISNDLFVVPADYEIMDFSEMFQGLPAIPGS
ncbi:DUF4412 domain-containing protein [Anoxynatronum buryatiense]|uniref:Outer membrane lipoprotein-sorting protein n=1 Tax=Anoxynatronum buryatiense TaxID=489973 RepID=A0AA45WXD2_9CLOT|nr:DUF4412 domain-containing protein [Anoxynatronum buryatiense]SMP62488.1 Outer membrane lipoprotein-sorting protein [Anoxynatronum buryatiense]